MECRAETLDECHRPGLGAGGDGESGVLDEVSRDCTVDNAQDLAQYLRLGGEQEAQGIGEREGPLTDRLLGSATALARQTDTAPALGSTNRPAPATTPPSGSVRTTSSTPPTSMAPCSSTRAATRPSPRCCPGCSTRKWPMPPARSWCATSFRTIPHCWLGRRSAAKAHRFSGVVDSLHRGRK